MRRTVRYRSFARWLDYSTWFFYGPFYSRSTFPAPRRSIGLGFHGLNWLLPVLYHLVSSA